MHEVNIMQLVNEKAVGSDIAFVRNNYKMNVFVQVVLTAVNGITLR